MRSTAPAAQDDLVTRLTATLGASVHVQHGLPVDVPTLKERVYVVRVRDFTRTARTQQGGKLETYVLDLVVEVERSGGAQAAYLDARDRCWDLVDEIEDELLEDDELGDVVDSSDLASITEVFVLPRGDNTGWVARATPVIAVEATV